MIPWGFKKKKQTGHCYEGHVATVLIHEYDVLYYTCPISLRNRGW